MEKFICQYCGKEFEAKKSSKRKYCCKICSTNAIKGSKNLKNSKEKIQVKCLICGKIEYVRPSRAKNYLTCSRKCQHEFLSQKFDKKIECICSYCGKLFKLKPYTYNKVQHPCCSRECAAKLKETTFQGLNNHQFGLNGPLNATFIEGDIKRKNGKKIDVMVYDPNCIESDSSGRVKKHRQLIYQNKNKFHSCIFKDGLIDPSLNIHHIDCDHDHNYIENLIPLTKRQHKIIHAKLGYNASELLTKIIGVVKQGELLENLEEDNQQPSLYGNIFEGSETNSRIQLDSNADTSALLQQVIDLLNDYIVQTRNITKESYDKTVQEILESEIKSSEIIQ